VNGLVLVLLGLVVGGAGIWSMRLLVAAAGAGAGYLVADAFSASTGTSLLVAAAGGVVSLGFAILASQLLFLVAGTIVGAVLGAKALLVIDRGDAGTVLALVFVLVSAVCGAFALAQLRTRVVGWATAAAGAALVLSGLGLMAPRTLGLLHDPETAGRQVVSVAAWVALAVGLRLAQRRLGPGRRRGSS
jgi:hypothetical protein